MQKAFLVALCTVAPLGAAQAGFEFIPSNGQAPAPAATEIRPATTPLDPSKPLSLQSLNHVGGTPAPVESVVSEALTKAEARRSPQSILPPAPAAPQYSLVPAEPVKTPGGPVIDMNPLGRGTASATQVSGEMQLEQAMMAGGGLVAMPASTAPMAVTPAPIVSMAPSMPASPAPVAPAYVAAAHMTAAGSSSQYPEAVGFGKDLPLALAVSQIVPPDYAFSFANSMNPGDTVSWEGGKPWDQVLNETLGKVGASASIDAAQKEVKIVGGGSAAMNAAPSVPPAYAPPPMTPLAPVAMAAPAAAPISPINEAMMTPRPPSAQPDMHPAAPVSVASAQQPRVSPATPTAMTPVPAAAVEPVPLPVSQPAAISAPIVAQVPADPVVSESRMQLAGVNPQGGNVLDPKATRQWEAARGSTLRAILTDWSMQAGVELFWSSDFDYPVESALRLNGTFEEAVQTLLSGLRDARPRPIGRLHPNLPDGPSVLVIETKHVIE